MALLSGRDPGRFAFTRGTHLDRDVVVKYVEAEKGSLRLCLDPRFPARIDDRRAPMSLGKTEKTPHRKLQEAKRIGRVETEPVVTPFPPLFSLRASFQGKIKNNEPARASVRADGTVAAVEADAEPRLAGLLKRAILNCIVAIGHLVPDALHFRQKRFLARSHRNSPFEELGTQQVRQFALGGGSPRGSHLNVPHTTR